MKSGNLQIKVCGMNNSDNINRIIPLSPDYMGFIFYKPSSRNACDTDEDIIKNIPSSICPVGVFVDSTLNEIVDRTSKCGIKTVQLHGSESPAFCRQLKDLGYKIIKAVRISDNVPDELTDFTGVVDMFLFDTAGKNPGGNGKKFNWEALKQYRLRIPFLLSGGIGPEDIEKIRTLDLPHLIGVDVNSKFEKSPGIKDPDSLRDFMESLRT